MGLVRMTALLVLLAMSGFAQTVRYNFDRSADFSRYKTYQWVQIKEGSQLNPLVDEQLKNAIDAELSRKGLTKVDGNSDLLAGYQAAITEEKQFDAYTSGFGPGWGYGPGWGLGWYGGFGSVSTTVQSSTIQVGSIVFDMYDAAQQKLVWRGEASKTLDPKAKPDKQQKNLQKGVAKLLQNYPPPVKE